MMASKILTLSTLATGAVASKILILGDSMGEFTCGSEGYPGTNHFKETCKGSEVINKAAAGTTAYQWRVGGDQEASEAFAAAGSGVTHVWLSVGGNDFQSPAEGKSTPSVGLCAFFLMVFTQLTFCLCTVVLLSFFPGRWWWSRK